MATCYRCRKDIGLLGGFNKQTGRCGKCENEINQALGRFRMTFINYCSDGVLTEAEWNSLLVGAQREGISKQEAMAFIRGDAVNFVERALVFAAADGVVSDDEEKAIHRLISSLEIPTNLSQPIISRLMYLKRLSNIRQGNLPATQPSVRLEIDEICHLEIPATFNKINAKSVTPIPGRLLATNRKVLFLSQSGGTEILLKNIMRVSAQSGGVYLELSKKTGNGFYSVHDPFYTEAVIETLVRISKREIVNYQADKDVRRISQDVKAAVWQRDKGKCVECGESKFLELDHIIPWSKGGASSVNNLQLLCRGCNQIKGNRI
jgi:hypothetical protein